MPTITLYSKPNCPLCDQARYHLQQLLAGPEGLGWTLDEQSILDDPALYRAYRYAIPVVAVEGGVTLVAPLSLQADLLRRALAQGGDARLQATAQAGLGAAAEERARLEQAEAAAPSTPPETAPATLRASPPAPPGATGSPLYYQPAPLPPPLRWINNVANGMIRHFMGITTTIFGIWVILPWLAPVFARLGWWDGANAIYTIYLFFCHQLPEREAILFGYEVASCWRCTALYGSMLLVGVLCLTWGQSGRGPAVLRRGISWQVLVLCAIPIALDGFSHMFGLRVDNAWFDALTGRAFHAFTVGDQVGSLNWWLRIFSGTLFGSAAALFGYPWMAKMLHNEAMYRQGGPALPPPAGVLA